MATLVTGAFGCIGAWVCKRLLEAGERTVAFDVGDDPWRMRMLLGDELLRDVVMVKGDIADREGVTRVVGEHEITRIIHLAAWQVPLCRQDPSRGALINVVGTANVFEAAKAHRDRVSRVAYFSSAGVFGPPHLYGPGPVTDDSPPRPATHYGVYKVANEETALDVLRFATGFDDITIRILFDELDCKVKGIEVFVGNDADASGFKFLLAKGAIVFSPTPILNRFQLMIALSLN